MISPRVFGENTRNGTEKAKNIVKLDEDVAAMFPDAKSVNDALRALARIIDQHAKQAERTKKNGCRISGIPWTTARIEDRILIEVNKHDKSSKAGTRN